MKIILDSSLDLQSLLISTAVVLEVSKMDQRTFDQWTLSFETLVAALLAVQKSTEVLAQPTVPTVPEVRAFSKGPKGTTLISEHYSGIFTLISTAAVLEVFKWL